MTPSPTHIARALDADEADPFALPPRGRGMWVGDDPRLEHRVACLAYASTRDDLEAAARAAFGDYPRPSPGQTRILDCLRLHPLRPSVDDARAWWRGREKAA